jgi:hypothetical protein
MARPRSRIARFLFYVLACVLICAAFASELPEQLTLTCDTSNDYTFRSPAHLKFMRALSSACQDAILFVTTPSPLPPWRAWSTVPTDAAFRPQSLFILHSVLRT